MRLAKRPAAVIAVIVVIFVCLCRTVPAFSQSVLSVGTADTFDLATWNIEWFGSTGSGQGPIDVNKQRDGVAKVILESDIDLWSLQEISDTRQFQRLLDSLGTPWAGIRATTTVTQRIAYIYNTDVVSIVQSEHILKSFSTGPTTGQNYFAGRPPLQITIDVTIGGVTTRLTVINLHMKCCADQLSHSRRTNASDQLKRHLDSSALAGESVIVAGDFNDELSSSIRPGSPSPYENFLADPTQTRFTTLPLDQNNIPTFCTNFPCLNGSTLDHILITDELFEQYEAGSAARLESALSEIFNFVQVTSDHLPVYARFAFPTNTSTDSRAEFPERLSIRELYPNPSRDQLEITIETLSTESVLVEVYDLLGRKHSAEIVRPARSPESRIVIDTSALAAGVYLLRVSIGSQTSQATFVRGNR